MNNSKIRQETKWNEHKTSKKENAALAAAERYEDKKIIVVFKLKVK